MGVLPGHSPMIVLLRGGTITLHEGGRPTAQLFVSGGFAEITPERCTVLADEATPFEQVTPEQLADRERLAQEELNDAATDAERAVAQKNLSIAKDLRRAQAYYASR